MHKLLIVLLVSFSAHAADYDSDYGNDKYDSRYDSRYSDPDRYNSGYTGPYYNGSYVGKIFGGSPVPPTEKTVPNNYIGNVYSAPRTRH